MKICFSILAILMVTFIATSAAKPKTNQLGKTDYNLLDALKKPANQQSTFTRKVSQHLSKSLVPKRKDAEKLAFHAFFKKFGMGDNDSFHVTGLYRLGVDVPQFAAARDLIWEVRVERFDFGVAGVVWVSTTTKHVKVIFPVKP